MQIKEKLAISYLRAKFKILTIISPRKAAEKAFELFCTPMLRSGKRRPPIFSFAEMVHFELNGLKIKGYCWDKDRPHKVLILHGFGSAAHKFHQYIEPLLEKGYGVMAFDAPAHGSSEGSTINVIQYSEMIQYIINCYGPVDSFLAHSFGGIALSLALEKAPHDENTKIVFIAPATETTTAVDIAFKMLNLKNIEVRKAFDNIIFEISGKKTEWFSIKRAMQNIKANVLWIHDEDDDVTPLNDALKVKEKNFPNIRFLITKGLGHRKIYGDNTVKHEVMQFL